MRNRALHDALREFALEAAALLTEELRSGVEIEFDVLDEGGRGGPVLYRYQPRVRAFIAERWARLRELESCARAADRLGAGAAAWLRVNGLRGEQAEPALQAMLERLYEDATSFGFPEERFERVYREVEVTLYHDAVRARVVAPLPGAWIEAERIELGGGLALVRGDRAEAPPEAVWPEDGDGEPALLCVLERDVPAGERPPAAEAADRFGRLVTALRLWRPGTVSLGTPGWRQADEGRWSPVPLGRSGAGGGGRWSSAPGGFGAGRGEGWLLPAGEEAGLRDFAAALEESTPGGVLAWALGRFEMGCERAHDSEALSDYLLALRALLEVTSDAGEASLAPRVAALCAEDGERRVVQRRIEAAMALERLVMGGAGRPPADSPRELVAEVEGHVRALLRDVLCGYLDPDLKALADDILLETSSEPLGEIQARDLRKEPRFEREAEPERFEREPEPDTREMEPVAVEAELQPEGVTKSADWGGPEDYSAPV
jgi:hypothetical protein